MPKYPYKQVGTSFDRNYRNDENQFKKDVEADFIDHDTRIDNIVASVGTSNTEIVDARYDSVNAVTHTTLKDRLDNTTSQLAENTTDYINLGKTNEGGTSDKDNHSLLTALVAKAKTDKKGLYIPNGKFYCSENLIIDGIRNIRIDGEIILATGKVLDIYFDSRSSFACDWHINRVSGKVRMSGLKNGKVTVQQATELELYANGDDVLKSSIAYSQFTLGTITTFKIFSEGVGIGWINENAFYGGRIVNLTIDGNYIHNNNTFYKAMLEACNVNIVRGSTNIFEDVRFEGNCFITFEVDSYGNGFRKSWSNGKQALYSTLRAPNETVVDKGTGNYIETKQQSDLLVHRIIDLNGYSKNLEHPFVQKENGKLKLTTAWKNIISTGAIAYPDFPVGFTFKTDILSLRPYVKFYDSNMQPIQADNSLVSIGLTWNSTNQQYQAGADVALNRILLLPNANIKYFEFRLEIGSVAPVTPTYLWLDFTCKKSDNYRYIIDSCNRLISKSSASVVDIRDYEYLIPNKNLVSDPLQWNWTEAFKTAISNLREGQKLSVPNGSYKIFESLTAKTRLKIEGEDSEKTVLLFQGVSGIVTTARTDYIQLSNIKIKDELSAVGTVGIKLISYSSYHRFKNVNIEGFGQWALYQEGGQTFKIDTIETLNNGNNSTDGEGGSIFITVQASDTSKVTTTGLIENLYLRSGGKYGFRLNRAASLNAKNVTVEYHDIPFYATNVSYATVENFYEEANRLTGLKVQLLDSHVVFLNPYLFEPIVRTWSGVALSDRQTVFFSRNDMETRYLKANQINLEYSSSRTTNTEGGLRYNNKTAEIYTGAEWEKLRKDKSTALSFTPSQVVTYDLGAYDIDRVFELTITAMNTNLNATTRFGYKKYLIVQGSYDLGYLQTSLLNDVGSLFAVAFRESVGRLLIDVTGGTFSSTLGKVVVNHIDGTDAPIVKL